MRIAALPEREPRKPLPPSSPGPGDDRARTLIESEIVMVDDDGTEEPFDPASWFK